jgi:hypothetical protein
MSSFIFEIYNKETSTSSIVDVTLSGGGYAINIDEVYSGIMIQDNTAPLGYYTTDKNLFPYLEQIAHALANRRSKVSISELIAAMIGIVLLITFLFGTVFTFRIKQMIRKVKIFILLNFLPAIAEFLGLGQELC